MQVDLLERVIGQVVDVHVDVVEVLEEVATLVYDLHHCILVVKQLVLFVSSIVFQHKLDTDFRSFETLEH